MSNSDQKISETLVYMQVRLDFLYEMMKDENYLANLNTNVLLAKTYILGSIKELEQWVERLNRTIH